MELQEECLSGECWTCGRVFVVASDLAEHIRTEHGREPFDRPLTYTTATVECPPDRHLAPDVRLFGRGVRVSRCFACGIVLVD